MANDIAVIAKSFSRTFRRNALNNGLLLCQADVMQLEDDDHVMVTLNNGSLIVETTRLEPIEAGTMPTGIYAGMFLTTNGPMISSTFGRRKAGIFWRHRRSACQAFDRLGHQQPDET